MAKKPISPHAHGRSEIWERAGLVRKIGKEQKRLGALLRALRKERELTQEQAAEKIGIHAKYLQRVELGTANVTISTLVAIATAYRIQLIDFFAS